MEKQIIRQLYHNALKEEATAERVSRETKAAIDALLALAENEAGYAENEADHAEYEQGRDDGAYERHRDELLLAASAAEENGFVKGFSYAFRLFGECSRN